MSRPKGWSGDIWIVERYLPSDDAWYYQEAWFHNVTGVYGYDPHMRVRRATLTMEE